MATVRANGRRVLGGCWRGEGVSEIRSETGKMNSQPPTGLRDLNMLSSSSSSSYSDAELSSTRAILTSSLAATSPTCAPYQLGEVLLTSFAGERPGESRCFDPLEGETGVGVPWPVETDVRETEVVVVVLEVLLAFECPRVRFPPPKTSRAALRNRGDLGRERLLFGVVGRGVGNSFIP